MLPLLPLLLPLLLLTLLPPAPERPGTTTAEANPPTRLATENTKRRGRGLNARKIYSTTPPCPPPPATKSITLSTNARTTTPRKKRAAWQASRARIPAYASRVTPYAAAQRRRRRMPPSRAPTHAATANVMSQCSCASLLRSPISASGGTLADTMGSTADSSGSRGIERIINIESRPVNKKFIRGVIRRRWGISLLVFAMADMGRYPHMPAALRPMPLRNAACQPSRAPTHAATAPHRAPHCHAATAPHCAPRGHAATAPH